jgi:RNA polymerase sigma factor (sigma-70 family)
MGEPPSENVDFQVLLRRVRAGDGQAAAELVRRYEPAIRRAARVRLMDTRLNRLLDSMDICQSVLASFFVRAALGQYELDTPAQLLKLLATMTRNKLSNQVKSQGRVRRDFRRVEDRGGRNGSDEMSAVGGVEGLAGTGRTPSTEVATRELLEEARRRLSPDELSLLERREQGREWTEIAAELGSSPEAIRKRLARAIDRVAHELGLDQPDS